MSDAIRVSVPATTANLGVGYDCLGLALDLSADFTFEPSDTLEVVGCEERFRGPDNLVWTTYERTMRELGREASPLRIDIDAPLPLSGGLGSSAACVVAGVLAATNMAGVDREEALDIATAVEGHPDNVAPALLGGLVSSFVTATGETVSTRYDVSDRLRFVAMAPSYEVRTDEARKAVPTEVPTTTAIWQMGRIVACVTALVRGDADLLAKAEDDRLHEPYRRPLIADYEGLRTASLDAGASAFLISGSGSTMIAVCDGAPCADAVARAATVSVDGIWCRDLSASGSGAVVESL
jgi:homoserine kinase